MILRVVSTIGRWPLSIGGFGPRTRWKPWSLAVMLASTISVSAVQSQEACRPSAPALTTAQVESWLASVGVFVGAGDDFAGVGAVSGHSLLQLLVARSVAPEGIERLDALAIEASFFSFCDWLGVTYAVIEAYESLAQPAEARGMMMVDERIEQNMILIEDYQSDVRREVNRITANGP